ncbi:MAG: serine/threonine-protein kinase [Microbacteriaceae bacterium]
MRPEIGQVFGGRYQLKSRLAIGGMGEVWQALDQVIERQVAIKILKEEYLGDKGFRERFRAEARHAALVNHEGIAGVYDYGEEEGSAYLVMELVPGEALSTILERERILSPERVLDIVAQTASALHAAHEAGLVHRDIKPGNLLITPDGRVKITDFGIARIADQVPLTATGQVMGTVQYLSPEQASGKTASASTDIYSLGIVAYEALAGRRPFTGESQVAIAMAHIKNAPPALPESIPLAVRNLIFACIAKKADKRPATAQHLARAAVAIKRGHLGEALALVPAVHDAESDEFDEDTSTRVLPSPIPLDDKGETEPRKMWPLVTLASVLGALLIAAIIAIIVVASNPNPGATPTATPTVTPTDTSTPTPTNTDEPIVLDEADFLGKTQQQVQEMLDALGLRLDAVVGSVPPSADLVGTAYRVNPTGQVEKDTLVAVYFYDEIPTPAAPAALTVSAGPYTPGATVTISWPTYTLCPSGYTVASYDFTINGGTFPRVSSFGPRVTSTTVVLSEDSSEMRASYSVACGTLRSAQSVELVVAITP